MALKEFKKDSKLRIDLDGGVVGNKNVVKSKTYSKVKAETASTDLYDVAVSLAGLQSMSLLKVKRLEEIELEQEI